MGRHNSYFAYIKASCIFLLTHINPTSAFSWRARPRVQSVAEHMLVLEPSSTASQLLKAGVKVPTSYEVALNELQELESEPLCHRISARLLVNNCQLLDGKDEATVLTDSGRKIRDFVDSYAASLAICDLERGRFAIPAGCSKFQEATLSQLPIQNQAHLHVTSGEIDDCLSGLGTSDSAWNTWVSYRHKALRFCEAARADHNKDQNILLFQRLTKIMNRLTDGVDENFERRMHDLDLLAQIAGDKIDSLSPLLDKLQHGLEDADNMLSDRLLRVIKNSQEFVDSGLEGAATLERMLQVMLKDVIDGHAEAAAVHGQSLQVMRQGATSEMEIMVTAMTAAVAATTALHEQLEMSALQVVELESRQDNLERGMQRLLDISDTLVNKYDAHTDLLEQAHNITIEILDALGDTAASAAIVGEVLLGHRSLTAWWPYIWCPAASLIMGSYGLPPSVPRNIALVALGELRFNVI
ncbi:hypothetical protein F5Y19DRAFT_468834 [Xylariaceae sp. FL1651]|nr:hypothetical protein F5Y19DRAFT_468834 [Xylariaceae sp. FL1651]